MRYFKLTAVTGYPEEEAVNIYATDEPDENKIMDEITIINNNLVKENAYNWWLSKHQDVSWEKFLEDCLVYIDEINEEEVKNGGWKCK